MPITKSKSNVVLDLTGQTITDELRFDLCDGVTIKLGEHVGSGDDYGLRFVDCERVVLTGGKLHGHRSGITASGCDGFSVEEAEFYEMTSDGIVIAESINITIRRNLFRDFNPSPMAHPDAIQGAKGPLGNRNVTIEHNAIIGHCQGVFGQFENGLIRRNLIRNGFPNAISVTGRGKLEIRDNTVTTAAGAVNQSRITTATKTDPATGKPVSTYAELIRSGNTVAAFGGKRDLSDLPA